MAINYAETYQGAVDELFYKESFTMRAVNNSLNFEGVRTVNIYMLPTFEMNDYNESGGSNRYGIPKELEDKTQSFTMEQDRSFTGTIDLSNYQDTMFVKEANSVLARQLREVVIPEIDTYVLAKIVANAGASGSGAIDSTNAYDAFLDGIVHFQNTSAPLEGTFAFIGSSFYKGIRKDESFIKRGDMSQQMLAKGVVGEVEGIPLVRVPDRYFPDGTEFVIENPIAVPFAKKIDTYKIHEDPPGLNGSLIEGRVRYDCWSYENKKDAIYVHTV